MRIQVQTEMCVICMTRHRTSMHTRTSHCSLRMIVKVGGQMRTRAASRRKTDSTHSPNPGPLFTLKRQLCLNIRLTQSLPHNRLLIVVVSPKPDVYLLRDPTLHLAVTDCNFCHWLIVFAVFTWHSALLKCNALVKQHYKMYEIAHTITSILPKALCCFSSFSKFC